LHPFFGGIFDYDSAKKTLEELDAKVESVALWDNPKEAERLLKERDQLKNRIEVVDSLERRVCEYSEFLSFFEEEGDLTLINDMENKIKDLGKEAETLRFQTLLSDEADHCDCFLEINAGAGGTEAQDWAEILSRMYARFCERRHFKIEVINEHTGEEAGLKSITFQIKGDHTYGWLKSESGVHRLVRISPFDSNSRRHTSFASVWVYPLVDESITIVIEDKDIRIDTYRASGAGGQHVNKTESAIRITHLPTGIVVQCQSDRSQHRNKDRAFDMLRSRLYERELSIREAKSNAEALQKGEIGWGNQIRSYVLQPYQMVKDLRTGVEKGNAQGVLDGDIEDFLQAALVQKVTKKE
jgi:peptide chain release factor 2